MAGFYVCLCPLSNWSGLHGFRESGSGLPGALLPFREGGKHIFVFAFCWMSVPSSLTALPPRVQLSRLSLALTAVLNSWFWYPAANSVPLLRGVRGIPNITCPNQTYMTFSKLAFPAVFNKWQCQPLNFSGQNFKVLLDPCLLHSTYIHIFMCIDL